MTLATIDLYCVTKTYEYTVRIIVDLCYRISLTKEAVRHNRNMNSFSFSLTTENEDECVI
jgi:hypothetical protein